MKTFSEFVAEARRMRILRTAHYTTASNKNEILRSGFKDSPSTGTYHPDDRKDIVYTTPSSRVGSDYNYSRVNLKIVNPKVTSTDSPRDFGKNIKNWMKSSSIEDINSKKGKPTSASDQARAAFKQGAKVVRVPNAHGGFTPRPGQPQGSYIMMDKETANRSIDRNPSPIIRSRRIGRGNLRSGLMGMSSSLSTAGSLSNKGFTPGQGGRYGIGGVGLAD